MLILESWKHMLEVIGTLSEEELRDTINLEMAMYKRKAILNRLHQRYNKARCARERAALMNGESLS